MAAKDDVIAAIQACANASGNLDLRIAFGSPVGNNIFVRGETKKLGTAYAIPGFIDCLLEGLTSVLANDFGRDYQVVTAPTGSNATTAFQTKASLTTPVLTGNYKVSWQGIVSTAAGGNPGEAQLLNVTDAGVVGIVQQYLVTVGETRFVGGSADINFTGAAKQFDIQHRSVGGVVNQTIQDMRIEVKRAP